MCGFQNDLEYLLNSFDPTGLCSRRLGYVLDKPQILLLLMVIMVKPVDGEIKDGVYTSVSNKKECVGVKRGRIGLRKKFCLIQDN